MAILKNPLLSLRAAGTIAKTLTFLKRRKLNIIESKPIPKDVNSLAQSSWRHMFLKAIALWHGLSASEKLEWESLATPKHMTGYSYFISLALKPNPGLYLPLQGGTMQGDIGMSNYRILDLIAPVLDQEAATKKYVDDSMPVGGYTQGAKAWNNAHQNTSNDTLTTLAFNSEIWDTDNIHDLITNNDRLTCRTAGIYIVIGSVLWEDSLVGVRYERIVQNGVPKAYSRYNAITRTGEGAGITISALLKLEVDDYVQLKVIQNSGGVLQAHTWLAGPYLMMQRIG